jgi:hypothetical protein
LKRAGASPARTGNFGLARLRIEEAAVTTGVQFTGTLAANATNKWFTFNWNPASHMVWYMMPTTPETTGAELSWNVAVERASATAVTYWLTVTNLTNASIDFEARYAILNS